MYYINKIIGCVITPMFVFVLLGVAAFVLDRINRKRIAKWCVVVAFAWLWLWMTPLMTRIVGAPLEREFLVDGRVSTVETFPEADAIVLLGGSMGAETNLNSYGEMWSSADRVWQSVRLYKAGKARKIIATGDIAEVSTLGLLLDFGIPREDIEFLDARNTEEEAKGVRELLCRNEHAGREEQRESDTKPQTTRPKILLVTSAWHTKRARYMFEKYAPAIEVICAPADFENSMTSASPFSVVDLFPCFNNYTLNCVALHEWVGIIGYKLFR